MKHFLLTTHGVLEYRTGKATWTKMNEVMPKFSMNQQEKDFFRRYGLKPTIFNLANLQHFGEVPLTPFYALKVLKAGATATEEVKKALIKARAEQIAERELEQTATQ